MSGDLQTYQTLRVTTSSTKSDEDSPYISMNDAAEAERLQTLAGGGGYGDTNLLDEQSELQETLGELGVFVNEEVR